jgi:8-oxo-dGTP diphosphatase
MAPDRPHTIVAASGRTFATFPAAVVVPIVNKREELLLLESHRRAGLWEPVNGAVDEGETLLEAALREVREEAGAALRVRPLGVAHASTFAYDDRVRRMISVVYVMAHVGGVPEPGDDMRGSRVRWATTNAIESEGLRMLPPLDQRWLLRRSVGLARLWEREPAVVLQGPLSASGCGAGVRAYEAAINEAARPRGAHLSVEQLANGRWQAAIERPDAQGAPVILLAAEHDDRSEALRLLLSEARRW